MTSAELLAQEQELERELKTMFIDDGVKHEPITDGVVNADKYLNSSPKILWILKEPWEKLKEGEFCEGWSVTKDVAAEGVTSNRGALPVMAYIAYSVFNAFPKYSELDYATVNPEIGEALQQIAFINIKKTPGKTTSYAPEIGCHFQRNRTLLLRQIEILSPNVIIGGGTLSYFYDDFGLEASDFKMERAAWHCRHNGRLLIHANHPAHRGSKSDYVDDIVALIRAHAAP